MKRFHGPETRALIDLDDDAKATLTEAEAHVLERDVAKVGRAYGRGVCCRGSSRPARYYSATRSCLRRPSWRAWGSRSTS